MNNMNIHKTLFVSYEISNIKTIKYLNEYCTTQNNIIDLRNDMNFLETLFINCCKIGDLDTIKYLIEYYNKNNNKINIHVNNDSAYIYACVYEQFEIIRYLIEYSEKNKCEYTNDIINLYYPIEKELKYIYRNNDIDLFKFLFRYCKKINYKINITFNNLTNIFCFCNIEIIKYSFEYSELMNNIKLYSIDTQQSSYFFDNKHKLNYITYLIKHNYASIFSNIHDDYYRKIATMKKIVIEQCCYIYNNEYIYDNKILNKYTMCYIIRIIQI